MKLQTALLFLGISLGSISPTSATSRGLRKKENNNENNGKGNGVVNNDDNDGEIEENEVEPPTKEGDPEEDTKAIATMLGLTDDEARVLMKQQAEFGGLVADMEGDANFLEAIMPDKPDGEFIIKYKNGNTPPNRQEGIQKFKANNSNSEVTTIASKLSLKDAKDRGDRIIAKLEKKGYTNAMYAINGDAIEVVAKKSEAHDKNNDKGNIPPGRATEILELDDSDPDAEDLVLTLAEYYDQDPAQPEHTYGGRKISGGGYQCTTAFSVVSNSGDYGIATAAHCTGMSVYDAVPPESDYGTVGQREHMGYWGDVEWHTTPIHWDLAEYYYKPDYRWPVNNIGYSISKGQWICAYSRMRGVRECAKVLYTSLSVQYSGFSRASNLVVMDRAPMIGGDSGGPWSYYDTAYGVHSGRVTIGGISRSMFSRVSYLNYALGVTVITK